MGLTHTRRRFAHAWSRAVWLGVALGWAAALSGGAQETNRAPVRDTNRAPAALDYSSFRLIAERNIFNASRSGGRVVTTREVRRPVRVDTITLVGTLEAENGPVAFFDGSSAEYRRAVKPGGRIAGFTLAAVDFHGVQLRASETPLELRVSQSLRREDGGEWKLSTGGALTVAAANSSSGGRSTYDRSRFDRSRFDRGRDESPGSSSATNAEPAADLAGDVADEILRRLMEQREREDQ